MSSNNTALFKITVGETTYEYQNNSGHVELDSRDKAIEQVKQAEFARLQAVQDAEQAKLKREGWI